LSYSRQRRRPSQHQYLDLVPNKHRSYSYRLVTGIRRQQSEHFFSVCNIYPWKRNRLGLNWMQSRDNLLLGWLDVSGEDVTFVGSKLKLFNHNREPFFFCTRPERRRHEAYWNWTSVTPWSAANLNKSAAALKSIETHSRYFRQRADFTRLDLLFVSVQEQCSWKDKNVRPSDHLGSSDYLWKWNGAIKIHYGCTTKSATATKRTTLPIVQTCQKTDILSSCIEPNSRIFVATFHKRFFIKINLERKKQLV
jgi:hypothetical protein